MTKRKKGSGFGFRPNFYGEPTINKSIPISGTIKDQTKKPKLCGYSCGMTVYKDKITGYWMELSGINHNAKRCGEILAKKNLKR